MLLATRYKLATLAPEVLAFDDQPWVEQIVAYIGITVTRLAIYFIHRLGKFPVVPSFLGYMGDHHLSSVSKIVDSDTECLLAHRCLHHICCCVTVLVYAAFAWGCTSQRLLKQPNDCETCKWRASPICWLAAGIFYFLARAGAVSALPAHLMSDHVFLGSSLVAMLSAEAVLLAKDVRCLFCGYNC